jgi:hypothetical protein
MSLKQIAKQIYFEGMVHARRREAKRGRPSVVIFPSNQPWDPASHLRAWLVAPELEKLGWKVVIVPEPLSLRQRQRILRMEKPDVLLLQQTRHPLNQPSLYPALPCVLDADDGDYLDPRYQKRIAQIASDATLVIGGSRFVASCLAKHNPDAHVLWTCTPGPMSAPVVMPEARAEVVAWAHATPLAYPHEAEFIREVMRLVALRRHCEFWLFGSEESRAKEWFAPIRAAGGTCIAIPPLDYPSYLSKVSTAAIGLQPIAPENAFSQGKSFGKLLAYLGGQVAVVASRSVDHPIFFKSGVNGLLPGHTPAEWAEAILALLDDKALRCRMGIQGWHDFNARLTTRVFASLLDPILRQVAGLPLDASQHAILSQTRLPTAAGSRDAR